MKTKDTPKPAIKTELHSFLRLAVKYCRFAKRFAKFWFILYVLNAMKGSLIWKKNMENAF